MPPDPEPSPATALLTTAVLSPEQRSAVQALVAAAERVDGVPPLSEQPMLRLARPDADAAVTHLLGYSSSHLVGYAQLDSGGEHPSAELVVDPQSRRQGVATTLLDALPTDVAIWAHGKVAAAESFAAARDLTVTRELWILELALDDPAVTLDPVVLPEGLTVRTFVPGQDEQEWLRVNAAAFAHHPEQGRMTRSDLDARLAEPWFDPAGLLLVVPEDSGSTRAEGAIAAFHWTKVHPPGEQSDEARGAVGEVYVVGVDPAYQGRGLGRPVTLLGLHHLQQLGIREVILYVDGDNPAALRIYRGLGFQTRGLDRMYSRSVHPAVER